MQILIDYHQGEYSKLQDQVPIVETWNTWSDKQQHDLVNKCDHHMLMAKLIYLLNYGTLALLIVSVVYAFNYYTKRHANNTFVYHRNLSIKYTIFLLLSLIIKMFLVNNLFSYNTNTLPIYAVSELIVMMLFSVFKKDEDCFTCFQRCTDLEVYSIF